MIKRVINILIIFLFFSQMLYSAEKPVTFSDARVLGMGNTFTAVADDKNMLFFNPAGFATYGLVKTSIIDALMNPTLWKPRYTNIGDLTLISATGGISGFSTISFSKLFSDPLGAFFPSISELNKSGYLNKWFKGTATIPETIVASPHLINVQGKNIHALANLEVMSYARHYFGFGIFNSSDAVIQMTPAGLLNQPGVRLNAKSDIIFPVGIGIPIPGHKEWSVGATFKYFHRIKLEFKDYSDMMVFSKWMLSDNIRKDMDDYLTKHSVMDMLFNGVEYSTNIIQYLKVGTGYGFDLGLLYRPSYAWKYGLQLSDVYTKINWWDKSEPSRIPINARLGAAYMPKWTLIGIIEDPILALDVEDIFHQQEKNFFLKWHFGTEIKFLFRILSLRFGINDGYPSYGLGIDLNFYFLSKLPVIKWLRPNSVYFPKFNPRDSKFVEQNPLCCCLTGLLAPLFYAHYKIDISYTGYELGVHPGEIPDYQLLVRFSMSYSY